MTAAVKRCHTYPAGSTGVVELGLGLGLGLGLVLGVTLGEVDGLGLPEVRPLGFPDGPVLGLPPLPGEWPGVAVAPPELPEVGVLPAEWWPPVPAGPLGLALPAPALAPPMGDAPSGVELRNSCGVWVCV